MKHFFLSCLFLGILLQPLAAEASSETGNDELLLKSGARLFGRILAQTANEVVMMLEDRHVAVPSHEIERIYDRPDAHLAYADLLPGAGYFPPWWVSAYDLFYSDWVKRFSQIPAVLLDSGEFRNVPYLSFRANQFWELNVYGNPDRPAAVEVGIFGRRRSDADTQLLARDYLSSYLNSIKQIRALDQLPASGGKAVVDGLHIEITPPSAPDSFGAWWITAWYPKKLEKARMAPAKVAEITDQYDQLVKDKFSVSGWDKKELQKARRKLAATAEPLVFTP